MSNAATADANNRSELIRLPLDALHRRHGARMMPFAGYDMPVQYTAGTLKEHAACRESAVLFDVSHMGQVEVNGAEPLKALERIAPGALQTLAPNRLRYTVLLNDRGGIIDDLMVTHWAADGGEAQAGLVLNAARKDTDMAALRAALDGYAEIVPRPDLSLLALQGPQAAAIIASMNQDLAALPFMHAMRTTLDGIPVSVTRSGYTGEDGYEISVANRDAAALAELLLAQPAVLPAGLAARDTLRLEAGLCLYGNDIDEDTSPVEANIVFAMGKKRREQLGDFPGAERIQRELTRGPDRIRVGIKLDSRSAARGGTTIQDGEGSGIGTVTSGAYSPTLGVAIAMGYVPPAFATAGTRLGLSVRGKTQAAEIVPMPFVEQRYFRG